MSKISTAVKSVLGLAVASAASAAFAVGEVITIDEGAIPGSATNVFVADQLSGQYDEVFTATSATTFDTLAIFNAGDWFFQGANITNGTLGGSQLGGPNVLGGYNLYAKFVSTGSFATSGSNVTFTGGTGRIELWADASRNTVYDVPLVASTSLGDLVLTSGVGSDSDDFMLGFADLLTAGEGNATGGLANGNFELIFDDWVLTSPEGEAYFIAPRPFHTRIDINGNFQSFVPVSGQSVLLLDNSANAFFAVPEPGTLSLLGLSMLGLGALKRRRAS